MKQSDIIIRRADEQMTRRDVANLVQIACEFQSTVLIASRDFQVNAKSLLGMIALHMIPGMKLCITAKGPDEEAALSEICDWFSQT